jgi:hypothetical protein
MNFPRLVIFTVLGIIDIGFFILILNTAGAEVFAAAYAFEFVQNTWVLEPLQRIETAAYVLLVPIFFINVLAFLLLGSVQKERERQVAPVRGRF